MAPEEEPLDIVSYGSRESGGASLKLVSGAASDDALERTIVALFFGRASRDKVM